MRHGLKASKWFSKIRSSDLLAGISYFCFWFYFMSRYWYQALVIDRLGNVIVEGHLWGDWAAHFTMGSMLSYREFWPHSNPFLMGQFFNYPFLVNWLSALLIKIGMPFFAAFILPSWIFSLLLVACLFVFFHKALRSVAQAALAATLFLLNGGLGIFIFIQEVASSSDKWAAILHPAQWYTSIENSNIVWMLLTKNLFFPQRALALGFPLTMVALLIIWQKLVRKESVARHSPGSSWLLVVSGLIIGFMPLIHLHSFLAAGVVTSCWFARDLWRWNVPQMKRWAIFILVVVCVSAPIISTYFWGKMPNSFRFLPGWLATTHQENWLWFWLKNWSLTPFLAFAGLILAWRRKNNELLLLLGPFMLLFVIANLFVFQPWDWDNTKLLAWSALGICGLAIYAIQVLWKWACSLRSEKNILTFLPHFNIGFSRIFASTVMTLIVGLYLSLIATGLVDTLRLLSPTDYKFTMFTTEEVKLADWVRSHTPTSGVWLTSTRHNHWLFTLTGRQTVMTYPGWLWSYGYNYLPNEVDVQQMRLAPLTHIPLMQKYHLEYVVVDDEMKSIWQSAAQTLPIELIRSTPHYDLYHFTRAW